MGNWKARFKGDFISAVEMEDRRVTMTIDHVETKKLENEDDDEDVPAHKRTRSKDRAVIYFKETDRGWVFAKTCGYCMAAMWGEDDDSWKGKRITLHAEMVNVGREREPGIRVFGSPDLDKPVSVKIKLPKRKAFIVKLMPTGKPAEQARERTPGEQDEAQQHAQGGA